MARPLIGVCAAVEQASFGVWTLEPAVLLPLSYADSIERAGGMPALLPPDPASAESPDELLDRIDALVLGGGADIDPDIQGVEPHPETIGTNPIRDRFEMALGIRAMERGIPLLGVCRGMQIMNVAYGGTLHQHLPEHLGHEQHRPTPGEWAEHEVRLAPGSLAARASGGERLTIKSHHHQGIGDLGRGFEETGWATDEETVEAIESPDGGFALGLLWHPEEDPADQVIPYLIDRALASGRRT